jgi:hypothetical protein
MLDLILLIGGLFIIFGIGIYLKGQILPDNKSNDEEFNYKCKQYFFSKAERKFYEVLKEVADEMDMVVFAKVRLADLVYLPKSEDNWIKGWNKIKSKHIDFVLCTEEDYKPEVAIELNHSSHNSENRRKRDIFIRNVFYGLNINLVEIKTKKGYDLDKIVNKIKTTLDETREIQS